MRDAIITEPAQRFLPWVLIVVAHCIKYMRKPALMFSLPHFHLEPNPVPVTYKPHKQLTMMSQMQDQHQVGGKLQESQSLRKQRFCFYGDVPSNQSCP